MTTTPAAVLWDMDGTLVNTESAWIASEQELVAEHGHGRWGKDDGLLLVGQALGRVAEILQERGGVRMPIPMIIDFLISRVEDTLEKSVPWMPGAFEILDELTTANVPYALVTMSYRRLAERVVPHAPGAGFQAVVTGDEVSAGKPDPEPYLRAAQLLGVPIERCVAVEDSLPGIASAEGAGARVLAVQHFVEIPDKPGRSRTDSLTSVSFTDLQAIARGEIIDHLR